MRRRATVGLRVLFITLLLVAPLRTASQAPPANATAADLERRGDELRAARSFSDALTFYRAALDKSPRNATLWNKLGMAELQLNHVREAENDFRRATKMQPEFPQALNNFGAAKYLRKDYKGAIKEYERALRLEPDNASFHNNLASALFERKQVERAMAEYKRAFELDPEVFERASRFGVVAQLRSPQDRALYFYMVAKLYAQAGNMDGALNFLKKALEEGFKDIGKINTDAEFTKLRRDPRWELILKRQPEELPK